jgi:hypothetical protein
MKEPIAELKIFERSFHLPTSDGYTLIPNLAVRSRFSSNEAFSRLVSRRILLLTVYRDRVP